MIIEHNGKRIDTEREIRWQHDKEAAHYTLALRNGHHVVEYQLSNGTWTCEVISDRQLINNFENVPVKHVRWHVVSRNSGYTSEADAVKDAAIHHVYVVAKAEWES